MHTVEVRGPLIPGWVYVGTTGTGQHHMMCTYPTKATARHAVETMRKRYPTAVVLAFGADYFIGGSDFPAIKEEQTTMSQTQTVKGADVARARHHALNKVADLKAAIREHLEAGDRNFGGLRVLVNEYADWQNAADVLSGQTRVDTVPEGWTNIEGGGEHNSR